MVCSIAPFDLYCAMRLIALLELYCASVSQYYLSFKLSGKVVFCHLFCHLSFYFFAPVAFILVSELSSGLLPLPFKVRITIGKQSPNGKLYDR